MKVVAAYLLAVLGGNANPSADDLNRILSSVGIEADDEKVELLLSQVKGKDLTELIAAGRHRLAAIPSSGAAVAGTAAAVGGPSGSAPATTAAAAAPKGKEEEKIEEESDDDMCFSLFD